jgi:hypothetical protein
MKNKWLLLIVGALVVMVFVALMVFPIHVNSDTKPKMDDVISSPVLEDYARDPEKADEKYGGKTVIVSGIVSVIHKHDGFHSLLLRRSRSYGDPVIYGVICFDFPALDKIRDGDTVTIKGKSKYLSQTWYSGGHALDEVGGLQILMLPYLTECQRLPNK